MLQCTNCNFSAKNKRSLAIHMSLKHSDEYKKICLEKKIEATKGFEFKCPICINIGYETYKGVADHLSRTHHIESAMDRYMMVYNITEVPKCKCGCGCKVEFGTMGNRFSDFLPGHHSKVVGYFGNDTNGFYTKEGLKKSQDKRKQMWADGEIIPHNKGKKASEIYSPEIIAKRLAATQSTERREKLSKALKGKPKSEEHKKIMLKTLEKNRKEILKGNPSKLESMVAAEFDRIGLKYESQYELEGFHYDFYLPEYNVLLEVHGDYWHGNPRVYDTESLNPMQRKNIGLDKMKYSICNKLGISLYILWECDVRKNVSESIISVCGDFIKFS